MKSSLRSTNYSFVTSMENKRANQMFPSHEPTHACHQLTEGRKFIDGCSDGGYRVNPRGQLKLCIYSHQVDTLERRSNQCIRLRANVLLIEGSKPTTAQAKKI